jgi:Lon protease-like protein
MTEPDDAIEPSDLEQLAVFPLPNAVLFPGARMPLHVFEPRYRDMIHDVLKARRRLAVARLRPGFEQDYYARPAVLEVCGLGTVAEHERRPDGRYDILVRGLARVRLLEELPPHRSYRLFRAERLNDGIVTDPAALAAWQLKLAALWERLRPHLAPAVRDLKSLAGASGNAALSADRIADAIIADPDERQHLLEELDPLERFSRLIARVDELVSALSPEVSASSFDVN